MKVAHTVIIDATKGTIEIEGVVFPYYVMPDPEVELTAEGVAGAPAIVHIGIIASNVLYRGEDGGRVLAQADTDTELRWARRRAEEVVCMGLADVLESIRDARG